MKKIFLVLMSCSTLCSFSSCVKTLTFKVNITATNCTYNALKEATRGEDYVVTITSIEPGYELKQQIDYFFIIIRNYNPLYPDYGQWTYSNNKLTISGKFITCDFSIKITAEKPD